MSKRKQALQERRERAERRAAQPVKTPAVPTLDRIRQVHDQSQAIGEFLDWLRNDKKIELCRWSQFVGWRRDDGGDGGQFAPTSDTIHGLLHEYFEIDPEAEERERRALLDHVREQNARSSG